MSRSIATCRSRVNRRATTPTLYSVIDSISSQPDTASFCRAGQRSPRTSQIDPLDHRLPALEEPRKGMIGHHHGHAGLGQAAAHGAAKASRRLRSLSSGRWGIRPGDDCPIRAAWCTVDADLACRSSARSDRARFGRPRDPTLAPAGGPRPLRASAWVVACSLWFSAGGCDGRSRSSSAHRTASGAASCVLRPASRSANPGPTRSLAIVLIRTNGQAAKVPQARRANRPTG